MSMFNVYLSIEERRLYSVEAATADEAKEKAHMDFAFFRGNYVPAHPELISYRTKVVQEDS